MKAQARKALFLIITVLCLVVSTGSLVAAQDYEALKGVEKVNAFFDVRDMIPKSALDHVMLIQETFKQLTTMKKNPVFVVTFMGGSVKLISSNRAEFKPEDQEHLKKLVETISKMSTDGIIFEVCDVALSYFGVDPASIQPEIKHVPNGWISEIGYQARGYSLVPIY